MLKPRQKGGRRRGWGCSPQEVAGSLQDLKDGREEMETGPSVDDKVNGRRKEAECLGDRRQTNGLLGGALSGPTFQTREKNWA